MSGSSVRFTVHGQPVPQGSKSAIRVGARTVVVEGNRAKLRPWRAQIADAAAAAMNGHELMTGPVGVSCLLYFQRPKSHYRANGKLRDDAPEYVTTRPDADKVARAIADAMTGVVYRDDSLIGEWSIVKTYGDPPRVIVSVEAL
jgi:crossover junction endodeoxyribonuclease RusA